MAQTPNPHDFVSFSHSAKQHNLFAGKMYHPVKPPSLPQERCPSCSRIGNFDWATYHSGDKLQSWTFALFRCNSPSHTPIEWHVCLCCAHDFVLSGGKSNAASCRFKDPNSAKRHMRRHLQHKRTFPGSPHPKHETPPHSTADTAAEPTANGFSEFSMLVQEDDAIDNENAAEAIHGVSDQVLDLSAPICDYVATCHQFHDQSFHMAAAMVILRPALKQQRPYWIWNTDSTELVMRRLLLFFDVGLLVPSLSHSGRCTLQNVLTELASRCPPPNPPTLEIVPVPTTLQMFESHYCNRSNRNSFIRSLPCPVVLTIPHQEISHVTLDDAIGHVLCLPVTKGLLLLLLKSG